MKLLVTGGLGFIGLNLVPELRERGHEVWFATLDIQKDHIISAAMLPSTGSLRGSLKNTISTMSTTLRQNTGAGTARIITKICG